MISVTPNFSGYKLRLEAVATSFTLGHNLMFLSSDAVVATETNFLCVLLAWA